MSPEEEQEEAIVGLGGLCRGDGVGVIRLVAIWVQLQPHRSHLLLTQPLSWGWGFPQLQPGTAELSQHLILLGKPGATG